MTDDDLITATEAGALLGKSAQTIIRWIGSGRLAGERRYGRLLIQRAAVEAFKRQPAAPRRTPRVP